MVSPTDPALGDDPRLPSACRRAMRRRGVPDFMADQIRELVTGQADPAELQCCHSGCVPCVQDVLRCAEDVARVLSRPRRRWWPF